MYMPIHNHIYIYIYMCICMHICACIDMHICIYMYMCRDMYIYMYWYSYLYMNIYIYMYTRTLTPDAPHFQMRSILFFGPRRKARALRALRSPLPDSEHASSFSSSAPEGAGTEGPPRAAPGGTVNAHLQQLHKVVYMYMHMYM